MVASLAALGSVIAASSCCLPLLPFLFAAGAAELEHLLNTKPVPLRRAMYAVVVLLLAAGTIVIPITLPLLPTTSRYWSFVRDKNSDLREEFGWKELTRETARIWTTIPPAERAHAAIYCGNYGEAGAIDLYGPAYGLPPVISGVNSYWLRGPGNPPPRTILVVGSDREGVERSCTSVTLAGHTSNEYGVKNEETEYHPDIFICRGLKQPIDKIWPRLRSFG